MHLDRRLKTSVSCTSSYERHISLSTQSALWTPPKRQARKRDILQRIKIEALKNLGDFLLFRESPENAVAAGTFDKDWKLPADAAEALKGAGTVKLNQ